MVTNRYPFVSSMGSQSTPSTVASSLVGVSSEGRSTPQRRVIGGLPHAAVYGESGVVSRRDWPST